MNLAGKRKDTNFEPRGGSVSAVKVTKKQPSSSPWIGAGSRMPQQCLRVISDHAPQPVFSQEVKIRGNRSGAFCSQTELKGGILDGQPHFQGSVLCVHFSARAYFVRTTELVWRCGLGGAREPKRGKWRHLAAQLLHSRVSLFPWLVLAIPAAMVSLRP